MDIMIVEAKFVLNANSHAKIVFQINNVLHALKIHSDLVINANVYKDIMNKIQFARNARKIVIFVMMESIVWTVPLIQTE